MTNPVRLQLSRTKGFRLQEVSMAVNGLSAVNVARPSKWGNPHDWRDWRDTAKSLWEINGSAYERDCWCKEMAAEAYAEDARDGLIPDVIELRGKNLACWCERGLFCHGDVLLELANA